MHRTRIHIQVQLKGSTVRHCIVQTHQPVRSQLIEIQQHFIVDALLVRLRQRNQETSLDHRTENGNRLDGTRRMPIVLHVGNEFGAADLRGQHPGHFAVQRFEGVGLLEHLLAIGVRQIGFGVRDQTLFLVAERDFALDLRGQRLGVELLLLVVGGGGQLNGEVVFEGLQIVGEFVVDVGRFEVAEHDLGAIRADFEVA